jgi:RNA polymerase sigma factor for flagellar operon FliA
MPRSKQEGLVKRKKHAIESDKRASLPAKSTDQRDKLVVEYYSYVDVVVSRLIRAMRLPPTLKEDFVSAGLFGLIEAAGRFKPERGQEFKTFAFLRIRGAVIDYIRSSCDVTGYAYRRLKALEIVQQQRQDQLERRSAQSREHPQLLEEGIDQLERAVIIFRLTAKTEREEADDPEQELHDPERKLEKSRRSKKIRDIVATLPEKERIIIEQYYFQDRKLADVAEQFAGLSKSWVSRLHDRAIDMLREKIVATAPDLAA